MPVRLWLPTLAVPKRRKGEPLLARLSANRSPLTIYPCAVWNGSGGRFCEMYLQGESGAEHQNGPAASGEEERRAFIRFATAKRLLRLLGLAPGAVSSSSLMFSLRYCHTAAHGKSRSDVTVAASRAVAKSTG